MDKERSEKRNLDYLENIIPGCSGNISNMHCGRNMRDKKHCCKYAEIALEQCTLIQVTVRYLYRVILSENDDKRDDYMRYEKKSKNSAQ